MSPFITLDQLRGIVGDSQLAGIDTEYNQQGIVDATNAEIGLYVVAQIGTAELAPAGYLMLRQAAADLVFYRLKGDGVGTESPTRQRADDALKLFRSLVDRVGSTGTFKLTLPTIPAADDPSTPEDESAGLWAGSAPRWGWSRTRSADASFDDNCSW